MKFKIGDKVRITISPYEGIGRRVGNIGTITRVKNTRYSVLGDLEKGAGHKYGFTFFEKDLELVRIRNTKIARKMNPTYKEDGKWLIIR